MDQDDSNPLEAAARYWNSVAPAYERGTSLGKIRRSVVWQKLKHTFLPSQRILELSCGTSIDAVFLHDATST